MISHDFTGQSDKGYAQAIFLALYSATEFLSDMDDAEVMIRQLTQPDGENYVAILEVIKNPLNPSYTLEEFEEVKDEQPKEIDSEQQFRIFQRRGYGNIKKLIADHFAKKGQVAPTGIPDFILSKLTPIDIENNVIEKEFMFAAEAIPVPLDEAPIADEGKKPAPKPLEEEPAPEEIPAMA